ncbi:hypothetical protein MO867_17330 [Microbulbifer sp. OS29]|uniref:DUF4124 domain-containing protein n=1 Tax=Microbulbifer okhotskensis TaxID=2926617 RepID=A0A9X2EUI0_9GAMM|nr:DUF4124 domain-containing protein [Microbulbifer okhotskensis]MCO1336096.1 hypothetical protein [Microbulbifer okhotskensis]
MKYLPMLGALLLVGIGLPMILPGPGGQPIMSPADWLPEKPDFSAIRETSERAIQSLREGSQESAAKLERLAASRGLMPQQDATKQTTEVFTWKDGDGNWHFSDTVPEGLDSHVRIHRVKPINSLPASAPIELQPKQIQQAGQAPASELPSQQTSLSELLDDVKAIEQISRKRQEVLDGL